MHRIHLWLTGMTTVAVVGVIALIAAAPQVPGLGGPALSVPEAYADLPGVRLFYRDTGGGGLPVVFLHANTGTSEVWENQYEPFSQAGYRVIAFDRRGWGKSMPNPATGAQPGTTAEDLQALVDYLKIDKFHLVGTAGGGFVALDYAGWHPERLLGLTVGASSGSISEPDRLAMSSRIAPPTGVTFPAEHRELGASYRAANPDGTARWIEIEHNARQPGTPAQPPLRTPNTYAKIETISVPTLLLAGDADDLSPPPIMRVWGAHIKGSEFQLIPESGHSIAWEQPGWFNRYVLGFLARASTMRPRAPEPARPNAPAFTGHVDIPGQKVWVTDSGGSGVPVVFLHSAAVSSRLWEPQIPAFAAAGYRVIAYDRRGWDRTIVDRAYWDRPGTAPDDLIALMDALGIDRAHLVGIAAGGGVALDFAVSYPQRVRSLSVVNHSYGGVRDPEFVALNARLRPNPQFDNMPATFRELGLSYQAHDPKGTKRWLELEHLARPALELRPPGQGRKNDLFLKTLGSRIKVPTMLTAADADLFLPPAVMQMVAAAVPHAHTVIFDDSGHNTAWEHPEVFNRAVIDFISRH